MFSHSLRPATPIFVPLALLSAAPPARVETVRNETVIVTGVTLEPGQTEALAVRMSYARLAGAGESVWRRGGTHIGQNLGSTDLWAIAIEPK